MDTIPRLLIIDDNAYICHMIEQIFSSENIELRKANDGAHALQAVTAFAPDLILLDVVLPDTEGYELYHKIKEIDKNNASIIFLTSRDQDADVVKGFSLGACDYIKKPFHNEILKSRIQVHLQEKRMKDDLRRMNEEMADSMRKLNTLAYRDPLTGLYNRRYTEEQLKPRFLREPYDIVLSMCDVDNFKQINDVYGHEIGDMVLIGIANIMESSSSRMTAIRWGGEEFLLVLFQTGCEEGYKLNERIRRDIENFPFYSKQTAFHCTITIGLQRYDPQLSFVQNVEHADAALYKGKRSGKNCCLWYDGIQGR